MERRDSLDGTMASTTNRHDAESLLGTEFEVFLNFRGPDIRLNFADCLYHSMDGAGIRVFRDDEEIRKGEAIGGILENAIKSSKICMPIFSRNYASSPWCLRELACMVDCLRKRDGKVMILPVFFDVNPDDVKLKTGLYHDALHKHEQKFGCHVVQQWKEALREIVDDRLLMHNLLRDLGREIVRQENLQVPEKRSRLWCPKVALDIVQTRKANRDLKVIHLMRCYLLTTPDFSTCLNLKILVLDEHCPKSLQIGSSIGKLEHLKHLEIIAAQVQPSRLLAGHHFDLFAVPSAICGLKYLSSLKLEGQCMRELNPSIGEMAGLTCLSLKGCNQLRILPESIGKLKSLLQLNLLYTRIKELPVSIEDLKRLEEMNLGFTQIRELPNSIGGLKSLLSLNLQHTKITELPASIGYLKRLECLFMAGSKIKELPKVIGMLENLRVLESRNCKNLDGEIPSEIGRVSTLEVLDVSGSKVSRVPTTINQLSYLRELRFGDCHKLERLPELPASLKVLCFGAGTVLGTPGQTSSKWMGKSAKLEDWNITWPPQLWALSIYCDDPRSLTGLPTSLSLLELRDVQSPIKQPFFFQFEIFETFVQVNTLQMLVERDRVLSTRESPSFECG
ncbi:TMV resistance protein N-like [Eucalyptus grandis]|uniref:TMV resistance protein N-like n=1 Tax=Eucalyptus grandis TaxID=71139 RepID=UPI00192ECC24|nr:TMV resistance protein N-like [Eucalyptus grandis]